MKVIQAINSKFENYFLSDIPEEITLSDRIWFYGSYSFIILLLLLIATSI